VAGLLVVDPLDPLDVLLEPPPEPDVALGVGEEALEPLSLELPPQPAIAAAIAMAPAIAQALILRSIMSSLWLPTTGGRQPCLGYGRAGPRVRTRRACSHPYPAPFAA